MKKTEQSFSDIQDNIKQFNICATEDLQGEEGANEQEKKKY